MEKYFKYMVATLLKCQIPCMLEILISGDALQRRLLINHIAIIACPLLELHVGP
jgi:hypothetical protein